MAHPERPSYLPELLDPYPRTNFIPDATEQASPTIQQGERSDDHQDAPQLEARDRTTEGLGELPKERQPRITLSGRVGAAPTLRTTPKGSLVAKFPLGVHADADRTTWHQIIAFGARAQQVHDSIHRGDAVEVIGYRHTRQIVGRPGREPRVVEELYATVVKAR